MSEIPAITDAQRAALERAGVVLCYLHGSLSSGSARKDSDADIAVFFEQAPEDAVQATTDVVAALSGFAPEREFDISILNEASPLLAQSVAARGTLLYARSERDAIAFQIRAMHEYEASRRIVKIGREAALARAGV